MMFVMTSISIARPDPRRAAFLRHLRRFHAWVGLSGATFGLLFGLTGFLQNHRAVLKIEAGQVEVHKVQIPLDQPPATIVELASGLASRFGVPMSRIRWRVRASSQRPWPWEVSSRPSWSPQGPGSPAMLGAEGSC